MLRSRIAISAALAVAVLLGGCTGTPDTTASSSSGAAAKPSPTPTPAPSLAPFPTGTSESTTPLPADLPQGCRDLLTDAVLAQLEDVPLNADGMGGGIRADSARVCAWGDPGAAGTWLVTVIGYSPDREARDALYALGQDGFTCYEPDDGIRCEKTWDHPTLPVKQGRTVFYRDGVFVDTQYSNLAPTGYTNAVIDSLWPASPLLRAPTPSATP
ncbi:MAG: hypothetical protein DI566_07000 [Microbacterium sp.]|nr:MAG: hypothetical protein DI566_07000 [Microbacterium sp.]